MDTQLAVAIVGVVSGIGTAVIGNWDKLFRKDKVLTTTFSRPPTNNFETELRYFIDVSGTRQGLESTQRQLLLQQRSNALSENPGNSEKINALFRAIEEEAIQLDDVVRALMPVYQKHYTLPELQELNKFYSTDAMQNMVRKLPALAQDAAPIQVELQADFFKRLARRMEESNA